MIPARIVREGADVGPAPAPGLPDAAPAAWPLRSYLELGALPGAVPCARLHSRSVLWEWRVTGLADAVELLVSELVTNAVQASAGLTPGPLPVRLWLRCDGRRVLIQVWDGSRQPPIRRDAEAEAENGRGLLLVETLSAHWGSYPSPKYGGKVVWAEVV